MKITATGTVYGEQLTVVFEDGEFNINDFWLEFLLDNPKAIGGTYYPEKYEPLNVYYTLKDRYFDESPSIKVEGDLGVIPFEEDTIY